MATPSRDLPRHPHSPSARPAGRAGPSCRTHRGLRPAAGPRVPNFSQGPTTGAGNTSDPQLLRLHPPGTAPGAVVRARRACDAGIFLVRTSVKAGRMGEPGYFKMQIRVCFLFPTSHNFYLYR